MVYIFIITNLGNPLKNIFRPQVNIQTMKLITETDFRDYKVSKEPIGKCPECLKLKGVYIQCDKPNGNNRVYAYDMMKPEVDNFIREFVEQGRAFGELEHPDRVEIDPKNAAIRITNLEENERDRNWVGTAVVLASYPEYGIKGTPNGDIVASLLAYGGRLGMSTRGCGEIHESEEGDEVVDFKLSTIDIVCNPSIGEFCDASGQRCVNGILESKEFMINEHGCIVESAYTNLEKKLSKLPKKLDAKTQLVNMAVRNFFKDIAKNI